MVLNSIRFVTSRKIRAQLAAEIRAQFEAFARTGLHLDHVNAHKHFHLHPTLLEMLLRIGREYGVTAVRVPDEPLWFAARRGHGLSAANTALLAPSHHYMEAISFDVADLRRALRSQLKVHFSYRNALAEPSERTVRPLCLAYFGPVWLLSAWCELRDDFRTFRLDRIDGFAVQADRFRLEAGKTLHDFLKRDQTWTRGYGAAPNT